MAGFMIAAPSSGSGKTILTCGLLELLKQKGYRPFSYKCGPDYIDRLFHSRILQVEGGNLDTFFAAPKKLRADYAAVSREYFPVTEGVMGYYDGLGGVSQAASTWEVARVLNLPVVLVIDARGVSASLSALLKGFLTYRTPSQIQAVILNRVSPMIYPRLKEMIEKEHPVRVAGFVPELDFLKIGSRHLGLVLPEEIRDLQAQIERLAKTLEDTIDWKFLTELSGGPEIGETGETGRTDSNSEAGAAVRPAFRLGVAKDEAFCFYYRENLEFFKSLGAELIEFSPLWQAHLPEGLDGLLLGGGYPELHAKELSANESMRKELLRQIGLGMPVLAECGGYLYLLEELEDADGNRYPMVGAFSGVGKRKGKQGRFGYIGVHTGRDSLYLKAGEEIRGHEFHYWDCSLPDEAYEMEAVKPVGNRAWPCVRTVRQTMAGFPHLYYPSLPEFGERFRDACLRFQKRPEVIKK